MLRGHTVAIATTSNLTMRDSEASAFAKCLIKSSRRQITSCLL
ncbi:hypothetical protein [Shewanella halifaxensis]|nr:hypothetical protein [Shewanella halifaxensis]